MRIILAPMGKVTHVIHTTTHAEAGCPAPVLTNRAGRTEMTRSMLCAVGLFLGLLIAPGARAYPTGKVVELTEANFDAEVRPFPHVSLLPRGRG